jgi:undecaprenyl pyrophosphate synthase
MWRSSWTATAAGPPPGLAASGRPPQGAPSGCARSCAPAPDLGIRWLTIYAFSTENWKRSTEEVLGLMAMFARYIEREADRWRPKACGCASSATARGWTRAAAPDGGIEARTAGPNTPVNLTVAINYGGRDEICAPPAPGGARWRGRWTRPI